MWTNINSTYNTKPNLQMSASKYIFNITTLALLYNFCGGAIWFRTYLQLILVSSPSLVYGHPFHFPFLKLNFSSHSLTGKNIVTRVNAREMFRIIDATITISICIKTKLAIWGWRGRRGKQFTLLQNRHHLSGPFHTKLMAATNTILQMGGTLIKSVSIKNIYKIRLYV